jgi:hypothetical protein
MQGVIFLYSEITTGGANEVLYYSIKRPRIENEKVDTYLSELAEDVEYYFNNKFKERTGKELANYKKGRAYCEFELTFEKKGLYSFIILMSAYDGNELVGFEYECITLDHDGELVPEWVMRKGGRGRKKNRNYYID